MNTINLSKVNLHAATQLRLMEDQTHIEELAHAYADNGSFHELPWVALVKETNEYVPIDGFHRLMAVEWLHNQSDIQTGANTEVVAIRYSEFDTMSDAIIAAAGVNATHGLKRQSGDIANAIEAILEIDPIRFMESKYKINQKAIMEAVNCSSASFRRATTELRQKLTDARDYAIATLAEQGLSQREIASRTGVNVATVSRFLSVAKCSVSEMQQEESPSVAKCSVSEMQQEEAQEEEPSVFNHITSASVAECPWAEYEKEEEVATDPSEATPKAKSNVNRKETMSDHDLAKLLDELTDRQRDFARSYLENM